MVQQLSWPSCAATILGSGHSRQSSLTLCTDTHIDCIFMCAQDHPKFASIADEAPLLYSRELQMGTEKKPHPMKLGEAVQKGIIGSQTLAYFIGRTYLFMKKIGMDPQRLRFRQHLQNEMAHYASDCWDAEAECSYGWIECAGLSDRSAFDLKVCNAVPPPTPSAQQRHCCVRLHHGAMLECN